MVKRIALILLRETVVLKFVLIPASLDLGDGFLFRRKLVEGVGIVSKLYRETPNTYSVMNDLLGDLMTSACLVIAICLEVATLTMPSNLQEGLLI
jgi:hypothetical protein